MPNISVFEAAPSPESWAEVRAHDRVMRYRRLGTGRPVLVLHSAADPLWPELLERLGAGYRLVVPDPPAGDTDITTWLADFLEGLGASSIRIVAANGYCLAALELALLDAVGITRLVLVADGPASPTEALGSLRAAMGRASVPVLMVRRGETEEGVATITDFLRQEIPSPT